jgi:hypothetical protein
MRAMPAAAASIVVLTGGLALAQTSPTPGPTKPEPTPAPMAKDIVLNPTLEQCRAGWNPSLKWTREKFEAQCGRMKAPK